jgi:hypothetical protein
MFMSDQDGVKLFDFLPEHLLAKVRAGIKQKSDTLIFKKK